MGLVWESVDKDKPRRASKPSWIFLEKRTGSQVTDMSFFYKLEGIPVAMYVWWLLFRSVYENISSLSENKELPPGEDFISDFQMKERRRVIIY